MTRLKRPHSRDDESETQKKEKVGDKKIKRKGRVRDVPPIRFVTRIGTDVEQVQG